MKEVVWLASYPRSGNTWLRFLLYRYLHGPIGNTTVINGVIPGIHGRGTIDPDRPGRTLIKTHFAWTLKHPFADRTRAVIHVRRHPKDVLLSGYEYHALNGANIPADVYANAFITKLGDPSWLQLGFGTWESHIRSWVDGPELPPGVRCHWTTYERLKSDTGAELRAMIEFLGEPVDEARLAEAVADCSLENLRATEDREKATGSESLFPGSDAARSKGKRFINNGRTGQSLGHISPALDARFNEAFAPVLARCGYGAG